MDPETAQWETLVVTVLFANDGGRSSQASAAEWQGWLAKAR